VVVNSLAYVPVEVVFSVPRFVRLTQTLIPKLIQLMKSYQTYHHHSHRHHQQQEDVHQVEVEEEPVDAIPGMDALLPLLQLQKLKTPPARRRKE